MVPILETRIYLWSEEKSSLLTGFSLQRFFVIEKYPQQGGREGGMEGGMEGEMACFETMVPMLETRIYQVESKNRLVSIWT